MSRFLRFLPRLFIVLSLDLGAQQFAHAQTHIYVKNDTQHLLRIHKSEVSGAKIDSKAWKQGAAKVAAGERERVLTIIRKGKVNWMDPTPRFIEPGKEVVFSTMVSVDGESRTPIALRQKLLGTGKTTKMWYLAAAEGDQPQWHIDEVSHRVYWSTSKQGQWAVDLRAYREGSKTHVEYTFSHAK